MGFKETKFYKWLDNYWYHYKWITLIVLLFATVATIGTVQMFTRQKGDIYVLYAGPAVVNLQNETYIERAFSKLDEKDYNNDGEIITVLRSLALFSPEEISGQTEDEVKEVGVPNEGYTLNEQMIGVQMSNTLQTFNQEILGGDSVICLLSPYAYGIVRQADGFLPLKDAIGYQPPNAYDDCSLLLKDTDFGNLEGLAYLPDDTLICIRRISSMSFMKGQKKTEAAYNYQLEKFNLAITYEHIPENSEN